MNKKMKSLANRVVIGVLGALSLGGIAWAVSGSNLQFGIENCNNCVLNSDAGEASEPKEESLGAGTPNRLPNGYWDTADGYYVDGTMRVNGTGGMFPASSTIAGSVLTSSTQGATSVFAAADFMAQTYIRFLPSVDVTVTLPASSTLTQFIPNAGDYRTIVLHNATTSPGIEVTLAAGAGTFLTSASSTDIMHSSSTAILGCFREATTDVNCMFQPATR